MKIVNPFVGSKLVGLMGAVTLLLFAVEVYAVDIHGHVHICAYPFNCIYRTKDAPSGSSHGPYIYDSEGMVGPGNNWSQAEYLGDIAKGYVGAWARATRGYDPIREVWCPASAGTSVGWQSSIRFVVGPGAYPDGLQSQAEVLVKGYISKIGDGTQVLASYFASFGGDSHQPTPACIERDSADPPQSISIEEVVTLIATLVDPGTVLDNHLIVDVPISAWLGDQCPLVANTWAGGTGIAHVISDFAYQKYVRFISISEPPGVTWTSAEGFLTMPVDACRGDFDREGDVDSSDLASLADNQELLDLHLFAARFGRNDCQAW